MEILTTEELEERNLELASAREYAQMRKRYSRKAKFKSTTKKPFWKSILDFLTK